MNKNIHIVHGSLAIALIGFVAGAGMVYQINKTPLALGNSFPAVSNTQLNTISGITIVAPNSTSQVQAQKPFTISWRDGSAVAGPNNVLTYILTDSATGKVIGTSTVGPSTNGSNQQFCTATAPCTFEWTPTKATSGDTILITKPPAQSDKFDVTKSMASVIDALAYDTGTQLEIEGSGFTSDSVVNVSKNGTIISTLSGNNVQFQSSKKITVTIDYLARAKMTPGFYDLSVTNSQGTSNTYSYTYRQAPTAPTPVISSINPSSASISYDLAILILGTNFSKDSYVLVDGAIWNYPMSVNAAGTQVSFTIPKGTMNIGSHTIQVQKRGDPVSNTVSFQILPAVAVKNGTLQGKATFASTCNSACGQTKISTLGLTVRLSTTTVQPDGSTGITVADTDFNADGTYSISLAPGTYYIYENNNYWGGSGLTSLMSGDVSNSGMVTIKSGVTSKANLSISNIKPNLRQ